MADDSAETGAGATGDSPLGFTKVVVGGVTGLQIGANPMSSRVRGPDRKSVRNFTWRRFFIRSSSDWLISFR